MDVPARPISSSRRKARCAHQPLLPPFHGRGLRIGNGKIVAGRHRHRQAHVGRFSVRVLRQTRDGPAVGKFGRPDVSGKIRRCGWSPARFARASAADRGRRLGRACAVGAGAARQGVLDRPIVGHPAGLGVVGRRRNALCHGGGGLLRLGSGCAGGTRRWLGGLCRRLGECQGRFRTPAAPLLRSTQRIAWS